MDVPGSKSFKAVLAPQPPGTDVMDAHGLLK